ncbi:MAG: hypothetical protein R2834_10390 [Rhodothermales bacterium]
MKRTPIVLLFTMYLALTSPAWGQTLEETPRDPARREAAGHDEGYLTLTVPASDFNQVRYLLDYLLERSRDNSNLGNLTVAAEELTRAASLMRVDAGEGNDDVQNEVYSAADQLEKIARAAETGSKTPVSVFDSAIFDAHRAIAHYHQRRARTLMEATMETNAGLALQAALLHYEHAAVAAARMRSRPADPDLYAQVDDWEKIAELMIHNENQNTPLALETIDQLGDRIRMLGGAVN